jgi:hypothetical protein
MQQSVNRDVARYCTRLSKQKRFRQYHYDLASDIKLICLHDNSLLKVHIDV